MQTPWFAIFALTVYRRAQTATAVLTRVQKDTSLHNET